jgi:insulysin
MIFRDLFLTDVFSLQYGRGLKNFKAEQPHQHALYYTTVVVMEQIWTKDELLEALDGMDIPVISKYSVN